MCYKKWVKALCRTEWKRNKNKPNVFKWTIFHKYEKIGLVSYWNSIKQTLRNRLCFFSKPFSYPLKIDYAIRRPDIGNYHYWNISLNLTSELLLSFWGLIRDLSRDSSSRGQATKIRVPLLYNQVTIWTKKEKEITYIPVSLYLGQLNPVELHV